MKKLPTPLLIMFAIGLLAAAGWQATAGAPRQQRPTAEDHPEDSYPKLLEPLLNTEGKYTIGEKIAAD